MRYNITSKPPGKSEAAAKKKLDFSAVELLGVDEGLCVQCMHAGPYDDEPATISAMRAFAAEQGYAPDFSESRLHHEIYLSDPRKCAPEKLKTVIRHPIKSIEQNERRRVFQAPAITGRRRLRSLSSLLARTCADRWLIAFSVSKL